MPCHIINPVFLVYDSFENDKFNLLFSKLSYQRDRAFLQQAQGITPMLACPFASLVLIASAVYHHTDLLKAQNIISILPHSGVFVVVGNKLENVALLFSSHLSFSSKFAEKPILVVCMYCSFARLHFTSLYETGKKFAHIQDLRNCNTLFYLLLLLHNVQFYQFHTHQLILWIQRSCFSVV